MFSKNILNATHEENNSVGLHFSLKNKQGANGSEEDRKLEGYRLFVISISLTLVFVWSWFVHSKHYQRVELWFAIHNWLTISFITEKLCVLTRFNILSNGVVKIGEYASVQHSRRYFLTLNAYIMVALALYSYNVVFKTLFRSPVKGLKWYLHWAGLFSISSLPTYYFMCVHGWVETGYSEQGYFTYTWQFAHYPGKGDVAILLLFCYILPVFVALVLMGAVTIELLRRDEFVLFSKQKKPFSVSIEDRMFIAVSLYASFSFLIVNTPFIHATFENCVEPSKFNRSTAAIVEILSFCSLYMNPCFVLMLYGYYWFTHQHRFVDPKIERDLADNKTTNSCCEATMNGFLRVNSEDSVNKAPQVQEEACASEKIKLKK
ncbi:uncharacterized protein TNCT_90721 [Trichonephila clavata]|uniref:Uncharacterized protein n=1 Tax=Trichonephila clavata TaxID=2740835 RepID=A0A8X6M6F1_TRICU|nr:uncharacterized protein TNCT_90721 [Trichonephila clavata]